MLYKPRGSYTSDSPVTPRMAVSNVQHFASNFPKTWNLIFRSEKTASHQRSAYWVRTYVEVFTSLKAKLGTLKRPLPVKLYRSRKGQCFNWVGSLRMTVNARLQALGASASYRRCGLDTTNLRVIGAYTSENFNKLLCARMAAGHIPPQLAKTSTLERLDSAGTL